MEKRQVLLQAVIDRPDDNAPRLVYADFLDKNGDRERAEFIRVQCGLAKMPPQAPKRPTLQAREKELLQEHGWDWAEEFGTKIREWVYRRGFIERVEMCLETSAEEILQVLNKAPIRHVRDTSQFCDFSGVVEALPHLERLTGLEFWGLYGFEDSLVAKILASPHLRNLHTLILHHDRNGGMVEEQVLIEAMASPYRSQLEELGVNIDSCWRGPSRGILKAMAQSPYLGNLRKLTISNAGDVGNSAQMDLETARCLGESTNFTHLKELDLGRTRFPIEVWDEVLKWPWLAHLKWLRLHNAAQVKAPDFFFVAEIKNLPTYRQAFEKRVGQVDWLTEFIGPWDGNTCWHGQTWKDRPRRLLFEMNNFVRTQDYEGLERKYRRLCENLAGDQFTRTIDELPFELYEKSLQEGFKKAVGALAGKEYRPLDKSLWGDQFTAIHEFIFEFYEKELQKGSKKTVGNLAGKEGKCIFLRLMPHSEWIGTFHVQARDTQLQVPYEEGGYETPLAELAGPRLPEAARLFKEHHLYSGTQPSGVALYLLAKTVAAFGRCLTNYLGLVPVYFSCSYAVFRMTSGMK